MSDHHNMVPGSYYTLGLRSTPASTSDLSLNGPNFMPSASRRQRRASLVSSKCYHNYIMLFGLQQDIGFGKLQSYIKLDKLGEVSGRLVFVAAGKFTGNLCRELMQQCTKERAGEIIILNCVSNIMNTSIHVASPIM